VTAAAASDMSRDTPERRASLAEVARAVLSAFFGVRKRSHHERDAARIAPWQIVLVAVGLLALFIFTLITIVRIVISQ
jgi:hypothetical protein